MYYKLMFFCFTLLVSNKLNCQIRIKENKEIFEWVESRTFFLKKKYSIVNSSIDQNRSSLALETKHDFAVLLNSSGIDTSNVHVIYVNNPCLNVSAIPFVDKNQSLVGVCFEVNTGFSTYVYLLSKIFNSILVQKNEPDRIIHNNKDFYFQILDDFGGRNYYNLIQSKLDLSKKEDVYINNWLPVYFATMVLDIASKPEMLIDINEMNNNKIINENEKLFQYGILYFMYCHEVSHLLLKHYKLENNQTIYSNEISADSLAFNIFYKKMVSDFDFSSDIDSSNRNLYYAFISASPILFFGWLDHLQKFERTYFNLQRGHNHPMGADRRNNLITHYNLINNNPKGKLIEVKLIHDFFNLQNFIMSQFTQNADIKESKKKLKKIAACNLK